MFNAGFGFIENLGWGGLNAGPTCSAALLRACSARGARRVPYSARVEFYECSLPLMCKLYILAQP
jgi:hypothetical protein